MLDIANGGSRDAWYRGRDDEKMRKPGQRRLYRLKKEAEERVAGTGKRFLQGAGEDLVY